MPIRFEMERRVTDALDLYVLISQAFIYARGADYKIPSPKGMDLRDAFIRNRLNDSEYPVIERDIKGRGKRDGVDIIF